MRFPKLILGIFLLISVVLADELVELECNDDQDCQYYTNRVTWSRCNGSICICEDKFLHSLQACKPQMLIVSNEIGDECPCRMDDAICNTTTKTCQCKEGFVMSPDKLRCIAQEGQTLGEFFFHENLTKIWTKTGRKTRWKT